MLRTECLDDPKLRRAVHREAQSAARLSHQHIARIMLTASGVKVVDFGISAIVGDVDRDGAGDVLGTPAYMAPERLEGGAVGTPADVYAIGVLLYRMLAGTYPWDVETPSGMLAAHVDTAPLPLPPELSLPNDIRRPPERPVFS